MRKIGHAHELETLKHMMLTLNSMFCLAKDDRCKCNMTQAEGSRMAEMNLEEEVLHCALLSKMTSMMDDVSRK